MENIKNKFFIILIIFLFILFINSTVFGYSFINVNGDTVDFEVPEGFDTSTYYILFYHETDNWYNLIYWNDPLITPYVKKDTHDNYILYFNDNIKPNYKYEHVNYYYWEGDRGPFGDLFSSHSGFQVSNFYDVGRYSANVDLLNEEGELVFRVSLLGGDDNNPGVDPGGGNNVDTGQDNEDSDTSWLDNLWNWFSDILNAISNLASYLNPFSENFILNDLFTFLSNLLSPINPFSEDFILKDVISGIGSLVDYINPFSENFFVYKLIELLGDLLKWLFVPSDDFFSSNIDNLKSMLSKKIPYEDYIQIFGDVENVTGSSSGSISLNGYKINGITFNSDNFIDLGFITKYKDTWYSWTRGVIYILVIIYNINQVMKLFRGYGLTSGSSKSSGGGDKE